MFVSFHARKSHLSLGIAQWLAIRSTATGRVTCLTAGAQSYSSYVCARSSRTNAIRSSQVTGSQLGAGLDTMQETFSLKDSRPRNYSSGRQSILQVGLHAGSQCKRRDSCFFDILAGLIGAALQFANGMGGMRHACLIPIVLFLPYHLIFDCSDIQIDRFLILFKSAAKSLPRVEFC